VPVALQLFAPTPQSTQAPPFAPQKRAEGIPMHTPLSQQPASQAVQATLPVPPPVPAVPPPVAAVPPPVAAVPPPVAAVPPPLPPPCAVPPAVDPPPVDPPPALPPPALPPPVPVVPPPFELPPVPEVPPPSELPPPEPPSSVGATLPQLHPGPATAMMAIEAVSRIRELLRMLDPFGCRPRCCD
jgi:hypothetical protein